MKPKLLLCLALVLSGVLPGGFGTRAQPAPADQPGPANAAPMLYVHFGTEGDRFLSTRVHLGEAIFAGGRDYFELKGQIERRGTNLVADLVGSTGQQSQFYRGNVTLEKPVFAQGGAASGGAGPPFWFVLSTNQDCQPFVERIKAKLGLTNAPVNHSAAVLSSPPDITNVSNQIDPVTGLPVIESTNKPDPTTGLPMSPRHESRQWGTAANGLQMSLAILTTGDRDDPAFEVAFRNMGEQDVSLNLGMMLANGKVQLPDKIHLGLMDGSGRKRELHFSDPPVAGRVDAYVVPLRSGSTYTLKLRLAQFWSPGTEEFRLRLKPGRSEMSAQFQGDDVEASNLDMAGMKLMNFWKGKLQSNVVVIVE